MRKKWADEVQQNIRLREQVKELESDREYASIVFFAKPTVVKSFKNVLDVISCTFQLVLLFTALGLGGIYLILKSSEYL